MKHFINNNKEHPSVKDLAERIRDYAHPDRLEGI